MSGERDVSKPEPRAPATLRNIADVFANAPGTRPVSVVGCMLVAACLDFISIGLLLPLIGLVADGGPPGTSRLGLISSGLFGWLGFTPSAGQLLLDEAP